MTPILISWLWISVICLPKIQDSIFFLVFEQTLMLSAIPCLQIYSYTWSQNVNPCTLTVSIHGQLKLIMIVAYTKDLTQSYLAIDADMSVHMSICPK